MVLTSPNQSSLGLTMRELDKLNAGKFDHGKTLLSSKREPEAGSKPGGEDLRSLRSEYDYGQKKKFVDVLGNIKKTNNNGLKGLEEFKNHEGARNLENPSQRSRHLS